MKKIRTEKTLLRIIRAITVFFILALVASGATGFPLETELEIITRILEGTTGIGADLYAWFVQIYCFLNSFIPVEINTLFEVPISLTFICSKP